MRERSASHWDSGHCSGYQAAPRRSWLVAVCTAGDATAGADAAVGADAAGAGLRPAVAAGGAWAGRAGPAARSADVDSAPSIAMTALAHRVGTSELTSTRSQPC